MTFDQAMGLAAAAEARAIYGEAMVRLVHCDALQGDQAQEALIAAAEMYADACRTIDRLVAS